MSGTSAPVDCNVKYQSDLKKSLNQHIKYNRKKKSLSILRLKLLRKNSLFISPDRKSAANVTGENNAAQSRDDQRSRIFHEHKSTQRFAPRRDSQKKVIRILS